MKIYISILGLFFLLPVFAMAQQPDRDDPFKRDPIFTKTLDELFGREEDETIEEVSTNDRDDFDRVVRRLSTTGIDLGGGLEAGPYYSNELYSLYPNLPMIHFNRVNGLFLGIKKERMQWYRYGNFLDISQIQPHGFIGWGTASKRWEYAAGIEKLIGERNRLLIGAEYHNATSTEDHWRVGLTETTITSFFGAYDFLDYHHMEGFGIYAVYRTGKWFESAFSYNRNTFSSVDQTTGYSMFGRSEQYRLNPPADLLADEIDLDIYGFSISLNPRKVLITDKFTVSGSVTAELADNSYSDELFRYNKYKSEIQLFYNFEPGSVLRWRMQAGGITGNAPDFKDFYLGGIGTLRGSPFKIFQGNQMLASNIEVQFGRPSRRAGEWIRDYNLHFLLFLDSGWVRDIPEMFDSENPFKGFRNFSFSDLQHDAGMGVGSGAVRFELAWPLKTFDSTPTLWVRFNPTF